MSASDDRFDVTDGGGTVSEVFLVYLKLGLTSFGGPIAHLGYFRDELVVKRQWIDEDGFADLVALCQFLPGPASSQVGFALGLLRGGALGAAAAWAAFTLPSAIALVLFAYGANLLHGPLGTGLIHGLKIVAVAVVAQAVWGMARNHAGEAKRATIALAAVLLVVFAGGAAGQVAAIAVGSLAGLAFCRVTSRSVPGTLRFNVSKLAGLAALVMFAVLLLLLPAATEGSQGLALFNAFYRAGALVFGGGHVVLPLLQASVVPTGWVSNDTFLAGYGAAQAIPGPLFTFAAYLGAVMRPAPHGVLGAAIALVAIFLPGLLLLVGALPFWDSLRAKPFAQALMSGANAAVVGVLGAALYDPVFTSAVTGTRDFAIAALCFVLLTAWKAAPWVVVLVGAAGGLLLTVI